MDLAIELEQLVEKFIGDVAAVTQRQIRAAVGGVFERVAAHPPTESAPSAPTARRIRHVTKIGRPVGPHPSERDVMRLRKKGLSWLEIGKRLRCSAYVAQQAGEGHYARPT